MKRYEGKMKKYEGKMKNYEGKKEKYVPLCIDRRTWKNSEPSSRRDWGKSYADAIPEMAPSTERKGRSLAKKKNEIRSN